MTQTSGPTSTANYSVSTLCLGFLECVVNVEPKVCVIKFFNFRQADIIVVSENDVESRLRSKDGYGRPVFDVGVDSCFDKRLDTFPKKDFVSVILLHGFLTNWFFFSPQPFK